MRPLESLLLSSVFAFMASASGNQVWSYVPAVKEARPSEGILVPVKPSEDVVKLVGESPPKKSQQFSPRRVFAVEIPAPNDVGIDVPASAEMAEAPIPVNARWPDAHDRISVDSLERGRSSKDSGTRNPWEARILSKNAGDDTTFSCGGIIAGGEGGPIGILNGRIIKRGDTLGEFSVAAVLANGLVLERSGAYFVIPRGRRTTVTTADR
jgi:hypothetical protein